MGGKSFLCPIFGFLCKPRRGCGEEEQEMSEWEYSRPRRPSKLRSSDEDSGWWIGDRNVDTRASDYINNFHQRKLAV